MHDDARAVVGVAAAAEGEALGVEACDRKPAKEADALLRVAVVLAQHVPA